MSEWKRFKVGKPDPEGFDPACRPFDSVSHTSHVDSAISIIEASEMRPSLVFDESKLNDQRILVSWLSPNHWSTGFRYGNVRFDFSFGELIEGKRFYWVESIAYKIPACRILITDIDRDSQLDPYDPTRMDGPWWFDSSNDRHYFNNNYCLEFMLEASVPLKRLKVFDFVDHHTRYCSVHRLSPTRCRELGLSASGGGAMFLTRAAVAGIDLARFSSHFVQENGKPSFRLKGPFTEFVVRVSRKARFKGSLTERSATSEAMMRATMSAFTFGNIDEARLLSGMFRDQATFMRVAAKVVARTVGVEEWEALLDD